jgi:hypothetical protein
MPVRWKLCPSVQESAAMYFRPFHAWVVTDLSTTVDQNVGIVTAHFLPAEQASKYGTSPQNLRGAFGPHRLAKHRFPAAKTTRSRACPV